MSKEKIMKTIKTLIQKSLVENSTIGRYRIHPLIRTYLLNKVPSELYSDALKYYSYLFTLKRHSSVSEYKRIELDVDNLLNVFNKCLSLNCEKEIIQLWENLHIFLWNTGRWAIFEEVGKKFFRFTVKRGLLKESARCCIRELSWLYFWQGNIKKSETFAVRGLTISKKIRNKYLTAYGMQRLGLIQQRYSNYFWAKNYLYSALKTFKILKNMELISDTYLYLGHIFKKNGQTDKAESFYIKSLTISAKIKYTEGESLSLYYLGEICLLNQNYKDAKKYFVKALGVDIKKGRKAGIAWNKLALGLIELASRNFAKANSLLRQSKTIYSHLGMQLNLDHVNSRIEQAKKRESDIDFKSLLFLS